MDMSHVWRHPNYYKKLRAQARKLTSRKRAIDAGLLNDSAWGLPKATSSQALEHKPSSPEPRGQASSPRNPVPGSGSQGTSESVQASLNRKQG